jgi:hypothetical protein
VALGVTRGRKRVVVAEQFVGAVDEVELHWRESYQLRRLRVWE